MGNTFLHFQTANYQFFPLTKIFQMFESIVKLQFIVYLQSFFQLFLGIIADLDTNSKSQKDKNKWISYFKTGYLTYNINAYTVNVVWDVNSEIIETSYALKGRGMELSELVTFDGRLLSFDDRTGLIFELLNNKAIPWVLLMDGDGK